MLRDTNHNQSIFGGACKAIFLTFSYDIGWHEELDRKLSQNSLGDQTKFGSKTTLNRRVS